MRENLIEVRNLRFAYQGKPVLKGISFDVATTAKRGSPLSSPTYRKPMRHHMIAAYLTSF